MVIVKDTKFPDVRISQKLKDETIKAAEIEEMNLSEYIREAVKEKNKRVMKEVKKASKEAQDKFNETLKKVSDEQAKEIEQRYGGVEND